MKFDEASVQSDGFRRRMVAVGLCLALATGFARAGESGLPVEFSLRSTAGEVIRLSEQRGSVVLLGFWARWCSDCRAAMQALDEVNDKYQRAGLLTLSVNVGDSAEQAAAMAKNLGLKFPVLVDVDGSASSQFDLGSMPLMVLIDRDGQLRYSHHGFSRGDEQKVAARLHALLNE